MFQRILVPLDGSQRAERALPVAAHLAHASGGTVILLSVATLPVDSVSYLAPTAPYMQDVIGNSLVAIRRYLDQVVHSPVLEGTTVETRATYGQAAQRILSELHETKADLVVMCSHGYSGFTRWALGSIAEKVARHAPVPVLMLRNDGPDLEAFNASEVPGTCVLVPLDGSELALAAIEPAGELIAALAIPARARLHFVCVVPAPPYGSGELEVEEKDFRVQRARTFLETIVRQINDGSIALKVKDNLTVTWSVAIDTDTAGGIVRVAESGEDVKGIGIYGKCALIAMATHGRGGLQRWTMGSVMERVLHETKLPVLIVKPGRSVSEDTPTTPLETAV